MNMPDDVREWIFQTATEHVDSFQDEEQYQQEAYDAEIVLKWLDSQPTAPEPDWRVLRAGLAALVGADTKEELDMMEMAIRSTAAPDKDKAVAINAIDALRETLPEGARARVVGGVEGGT